MTRPEFDPRDPGTWKLVLSIDEIAAIYGRSREAIRHALKPCSKAVPFHPAPFRRSPAQWRTVDVLRDLRANDPLIQDIRRRA